MNGNEFLKKLNRYAKAQGLVASFHAQRGKGSHGEVSISDKRTTLKDRIASKPIAMPVLVVTIDS